MAKRKQSKSSKMGMLVAILLLAVGFAAVSTTLYINGVIKIVPDTDDFANNVVFSDAKLLLSDGVDANALSVTYNTAAGNKATGNTSSRAATASNADKGASLSILDGGKVISFTTETFDTINQSNVLSYNINNASQYTAKLGDMKCVLTRGEETVTTYDEFLALEANATKNITSTETHVGLTVANTYKDSKLTSAVKNTASLTGVDTDTVTIKMVKSYIGQGSATNPDVANGTTASFHVYCAMKIDAEEAIN